MRPKLRSLSLVPLLLLPTALSLPAQSDYFATSPAGYELREGEAASSLLLGTEPLLRYQQIDATNGARALRSRIAFRRDALLPTSAAYAARTLELEVVCAEARIGSVSTSFGANYVANQAVVVARKRIQLADWSAQPAAEPAPLANVIPFDQPWSYPGRTATGRDLLWEVRVFGNDNAGQPYPFDFAEVVPGTSFGAPVPRLGNTTALSAGCFSAAFGMPFRLTGRARNHRTKFDLQGTTIAGPPGSPVILLLDVVNQDLSAPGLCNPLHALALALAYGSSDPVLGSSIFRMDPIPYDQNLIGHDLYLQVASIDLSTLQVSLSGGVRVTIPPDPPRPVVGHLWARDPAATVATSGPAPGGIVLASDQAPRSPGLALRIEAAMPLSGSSTMEAFPNATAADLQFQAARYQGAQRTDVTNLATWLAPDPGVGTVSATGFFRGGSGTGEMLLTAQHDGLTASLPVRVRALEHRCCGAEVAPRESSVSVPAAAFGSTDDAGIRAGFTLMIAALKAAGIDTKELTATLGKTDVHEEKVNSGGVKLAKDTQAATFLPGLTFYDWDVIVVYDGSAHIVFRAGDAADLRAGKFQVGRGGFTVTGVTALHELLHAVVWKNGIATDNSDHPLVNDLANMCGLIEGAKRGAVGCQAAKAVVRVDYATILKEKGAARLLALLGIVDKNNNGLPDVLDAICP